MRLWATMTVFCALAGLSQAWAAETSKFPPLAGESDPMAQKINKALAGLDKKFAAEAAKCRKSGRDNEANRTVRVMLKGAHYYSLVANDEWSCGGAHPDTDSLALTYDLATGRPVDWVKMLPGLALAGSTDSTFDGTVIGVVASQKLTDLYMAEDKKRPDYDEDCTDALTGGDLTFQLWPTAKEGGLALQPANLPHVVASCADDVVIPAARLSEFGMPAALKEDLAAAH